MTDVWWCHWSVTGTRIGLGFPPALFLNLLVAFYQVKQSAALFNMKEYAFFRLCDSPVSSWLNMTIYFSSVWIVISSRVGSSSSGWWIIQTLSWIYMKLSAFIHCEHTYITVRRAETGVCHMYVVCVYVMCVCVSERDKALQWGLRTSLC